MRPWASLLAPLSVWAAHFTLLWIASSVAPDRPAARIAAATVTLVALALLAWLTRSIAALPRDDATTRWIRAIGLLAAAVAAISIAWQVLPALFG